VALSLLPFLLSCNQVEICASEVRLFALKFRLTETPQNVAHMTVRNTVINYPDYLSLLLLHFILLLKTFSLFLGNRICLEMVLQLFTNLHVI
jgi:hypothetical protein